MYSICDKKLWKLVLNSSSNYIRPSSLVASILIVIRKKEAYHSNILFYSRETDHMPLVISMHIAADLVLRLMFLRHAHSIPRVWDGPRIITIIIAGNSHGVKYLLLGVGVVYRNASMQWTSLLMKITVFEFFTPRKLPAIRYTVSSSFHKVQDWGKPWNYNATM